MPYAKSCRAVKAMHGAKPDPGLLFDCKSFCPQGFYALVLTSTVLMRRPDEKFTPNPAGLNSMLFYHATIIIHGNDARHTGMTDC